jgi:hypothetical protein
MGDRTMATTETSTITLTQDTNAIHYHGRTGQVLAEVVLAKGTTLRHRHVGDSYPDLGGLARGMTLLVDTADGQLYGIDSADPDLHRDDWCPLCGTRHGPDEGTPGYSCSR